MALNTEKWLVDFQENLYPDNSFYAGTKNDSMYVQNTIVHIPNYLQEVTTFDMSTAIGTYPRGLNELAHTEKIYTMLQQAVEPYMVDPIEDNEFSYDKRFAVLQQAINKLNDDVAVKINWEWTPVAANGIFPSTGVATRANRFGNTVKRITFNDLLNLQTQMNLQNVPVEGRRLLVDAYGLQDIQVMSELQGSAALTEKAFVNGAIMRVAGFDVFMRSATTSFTAAGAKKAIGAADANTDLGSAIAFHPDFVRYAVGTKDNVGIKVFLGQEDPAVYGITMSAYVRVGASTSYDEDVAVGSPTINQVKGVFTLIEAV